MGRFEDLQRIQKLKENGSISESEFEIEKHKILNSNGTAKTNAKGIYIISLILGLCSLLIGLIPIVGLIFAIISFVVAIKAKKELKLNNEKSGLVTAGLILTIVGLIISILSFGIVIMGEVMFYSM